MKRKKGLPVLLFFGALLFILPLSAAPIQGETSSRALVVIDIQEDCTGAILKPPFLFQKGSASFIAKVNELTAGASARGVAVVYLRTNFKMQEVPGAQLDARLKVLSPDCFLKDSFDAFASSDHAFTDFLESREQIKELYLLGLDGTLCVFQTAKGAVERGFKTSILTDMVLTVSGKSKVQLEKMYEKEGIAVITGEAFLDGLPPTPGG